MSATTELELRRSAAESANGQASAGHPPTTLSQGYRQPGFWRDAMPASIKKKMAQDVSAWSAYLAQRKEPATAAAACGASGSPLLWGVDVSRVSAECHDLVSAADALDRASQSTARRKPTASARSTATVNALLAEWKNGKPLSEPSVSRGLTALAAAHILASGADQIDPHLWWQSLDVLYQTVQLYDCWQVESDCPADGALAQQLLAGELPLTLAYLFPEIKLLHNLRSAARERLSEALDELLNGEGLPHGRLIGIMPTLLACWTRCRSLGSTSKKGCWSKAAELQYGWLLRQSLRWTAPSGCFLLADGSEVKWTADFLNATLQHAGDESDFAAAKAMLGAMAPPWKKKSQKFTEPEPSDHCEWSGLALLRRGWTRDTSVTAVAFSSSQMQLEAVLGRVPVLRGAWRSESMVDGRALNPIGAWEVICWFSDDDVDYLELSIDLDEGAQLDRQIVMAREERFLLLADYFKSSKSGSLQHTWSLPLAEGCRFAGEEETRDGLIVAKKPLARAMPLALPEWRTDPRGGKLSSTDGQLRLEQQQQGSAIACPLLIDQEARRTSKPCTWRQLTVAQSLEIQPPDVAVGFRAQCAKRQWLIYRSLAERANRTLLGQNTSSDCLIARFLAPAGGIEELVEIEG